LRLGGVDDAGRGPIIGPLVIAGVCVDEGAMSSLQELGVRDSKTLSPSQREFLSREIRRLALKVCIAKVEPDEIDKYVGRTSMGKLNTLEAKVMARIVEELGADVVYIDSPDINPDRYKRRILSFMSHTSKVKLVVENHADARYVIVAAASIIAKVERDRVIEQLKATYGDFGSGYPSDPRTVDFLTRWYEEHGDFPPIVRRSWATLDRIRRMVDMKKTRRLL